MSNVQSTQLVCIFSVPVLFPEQVIYCMESLWYEKFAIILMLEVLKQKLRKFRGILIRRLEQKYEIHGILISGEGKFM